WYKMHMLLILLTLCLRKPYGISRLFSIAYAFTGNGCIPPGLRDRLLRVYAHHTFLSQQIAGIEAERRAQLQASRDASLDKIRQLMQLKGIGINGAWLLVMEFFGWRAFKNRREVGGLAGFTPTPYQSGESAREQGITKAGNRHVRW